MSSLRGNPYHTDYFTLFPIYGQFFNILADTTDLKNKYLICVNMVNLIYQQTGSLLLFKCMQIDITDTVFGETCHLLMTDK